MMTTHNSIAALREDLPIRIVDGSPDAILICDRAGIVRYWNAAAERGSIESSVQLLKGADGHTEWVVAIVRDVTDRFVREKERRAQLKAVQAKTTAQPRAPADESATSLPSQSRRNTHDKPESQFRRRHPEMIISL